MFHRNTRCCSVLVRVGLLTVAWLQWAGSQRFSIPRGVAFRWDSWAAAVWFSQ